MIDFLAAIDSGCMYRMLFLRLFLLQRRAPAVLRDLFAGSVVLCRKLSRSCSATITALKGSILCGIAMGGDRKRHGKVGMQMQSSRRRKSPIQSHDGREEMQAFVFNSWRSLSFSIRRERDLTVVSTTIASEMFVKNPSTVLVLAMAGRPHFVVIGFRSSMTVR